MDFGREWSLFSHETDMETLGNTLHCYFGVKYPQVEPGTRLEDIYEQVLQACNKVGARPGSNYGVSDINYFCSPTLGISKIIESAFLSKTNPLAHPLYQKIDPKKLDYLVLNTLFLLRRDELADESYKSLNVFCGLGPRDPSTIVRNLNDIFRKETESYFPKNFRIEQAVKSKTNIHPSKFLGRVLHHTIRTIRHNPYMETGDISGKTVKLFFDSYKECESDWIEYFPPPKDDSPRKPYSDEDLDMLLSYYAMERLYDTSSMIYLTKNREHLPGTNNDYLDLSVPLYLIPNPQGKTEYLKFMSGIFQYDEVIPTQFDWWQASEREIMSISYRMTHAEASAANLTHMGEYFRYMSTVYYPVLSACFYVAVNKCYPTREQAIAVLLDYAYKQDLLGVFQNRLKKQVYVLKHFDDQEWDIAALFYTELRKHVWKNEKTALLRKCETSISYATSSDLYTEAILNAVIRKKVEYKRTHDVSWVTEEQLLDMVIKSVLPILPEVLKKQATQHQKYQDLIDMLELMESGG